MPVTPAVRGESNPLLVSAKGQTYLVGDEVYLRPFAPADAEFSQSWRFSRFPMSPDRIRGKLDDGETGDSSGKGKVQLLIVRTGDDRPVGSVLIHTSWFPSYYVEAATDPIFGEAGDRWRGEAVAMTMRLVVDEWQRPIVQFAPLADNLETIAQLEKIGARECTQFREMYSRNGRRVDGLMYEYLNKDWLARLGDPADREQPRSGTGEPRPVTAPVALEDDPPANAVRVGPRVYLRPIHEDDAVHAAHWSMRESDANWGNGRGVVSGRAWWHEMEKLQKESPQEWIRFAVCLRDNDEAVGFVGIDDIDYTHRFGESESELINPAYRGNGYGSEAKHLLFDYAFNTLGLHVLQSWVLFENTRSAAALRKQGYRAAGRSHWEIHREGTFTHVGTFDLLADEWRAMPRRAQDEGER
jgi:RimJ/RimL family protein N-acetyltransferase